LKKLEFDVILIEISGLGKNIHHIVVDVIY
jgi:hypothetical protein